MRDMKAIYLFILLVFVPGCSSDPRWKTGNLYFPSHEGPSFVVKPQSPKGWRFCPVQSGVGEKMRLCSRKPWTLRIYNMPKDFLGVQANTFQAASSTFFNMRKEAKWVAPPVSKIGKIELDDSLISVYQRSLGARIDDRRSLVASFEMRNFIVGVVAVGVNSVDDNEAMSDMRDIISSIRSGSVEYASDNQPP